jgi:tRNA wybutosine-synthesizing protein 3
MTASLHHAKPLLSAAISSGFRESGVQSLKNLDDPSACPMVAVRSAGLGLEAIVACAGSKIGDHGSAGFRRLVTEDYLSMLLNMANQRFSANSRRIARFRDVLKETMAAEAKRTLLEKTWETPFARRERKREEGLSMKQARKETSPEDKELDGFIFDQE